MIVKFDLKETPELFLNMFYIPNITRISNVSELYPLSYGCSYPVRPYDFVYAIRGDIIERFGIKYLRFSPIHEYRGIYDEYVTKEGEIPYLVYGVYHHSGIEKAKEIYKRFAFQIDMLVSEHVLVLSEEEYDVRHY